MQPKVVHTCHFPPTFGLSFQWATLGEYLLICLQPSCYLEGDLPEDRYKADIQKGGLQTLQRNLRERGFLSLKEVTLKINAPNSKPSLVSSGHFWVQVPDQITPVLSLEFCCPHMTLVYLYC